VRLKIDPTWEATKFGFSLGGTTLAVDFPFSQYDRESKILDNFGGTPLYQISAKFVNDFWDSAEVNLEPQVN
jgi:hypothetical protein